MGIRVPCLRSVPAEPARLCDQGVGTAGNHGAEATCACIPVLREYRVGVTPTVLTVMAAAALGGGMAAGIGVLVVAAVIALVVLGVANATRALQQFYRY